MYKLSVDPVPAAAFPVVELALMEPQRDFFLGALHRVAAMDHVPEGRAGTVRIVSLVLAQTVTKINTVIQTSTRLIKMIQHSTKCI